MNPINAAVAAKATEPWFNQESKEIVYQIEPEQPATFPSHIENTTYAKMNKNVETLQWSEKSKFESNIFSQ